MNVPFVDLKIQHRALKEKLLSVFETALDEAQFVGGSAVSSFESAFAAFCGTREAVGVNSGTDALRFALLALGLQPGDEVITVPNTFIATTEAITQAGGRVVFVDVDPTTLLMDVDHIETEIKKRRAEGRPLRGILPVHLFGHVVDMAPILEMAASYGLWVLEDACQAHGAVYQREGRWCGYKAGAMGVCGAFSFYPGKNLGSCGEGGAVVTQDEVLAARIRMLRDHGQLEKYVHEIEGYNGRLHAIQAAILQVKLPYLSAWNEKRKAHATTYRRLLAELPEVTLPQPPVWSDGVYHLFVILVENRDAVQRYLKGKGVVTGIHYPIPLHLQRAYRYFGHRRGDFPHAEAAAERLLSLPMYPELTEEQITYVVRCVKESLACMS